MRGTLVTQPRRRNIVQLALGEDLAGEDRVIIATTGNEVHVYDMPFEDPFRTGDTYIATSGGRSELSVGERPTDAIFRVNPTTGQPERFAEIDCMDGSVATPRRWP